MKIQFLTPPDAVSCQLATLFAPGLGHPIFSFGPAVPQFPGDSVECKLDDLQQRLLNSRQADWFQVSERKFPNTLDNDGNTLLRDVTESLNEASHWIWSDARLSLNQSFWEPHLSGSDVVIGYADPLDCAFDLQRRWRFPMVMGLALWEYYLLSAFKQLGDRDCLVVSAKSYMEAPEDYCKKLESAWSELKGSDGEEISLDPLFAIEDRFELMPGAKSFLNQDIISLLDQLGDNDRHGIQARQLSVFSHDVLTYYGQLRAGVEQHKKDAHTLRLEVHKLKFTVDEQQAQADSSPKGAEEDETNDLPPDPGMVDVRVQIRQLPALEFLCAQNEPVISMLFDVLSDLPRYKGQMLYLNYGEGGTETLYFSAEDLLSVETAPASAQG